ncbi:MAG: hypothetical protein HUJ54_09300 [Erysipelotrichaceae bacterium]|nr:hypothetical protein [Erysipelotrichaceae bacterium]
MRNNFKKAAAAFAAAGLMAMTAAIPVLAEETAPETQFTVEYIYCQYDDHGLPVWDQSMCEKSVEADSVQTGRYYIYRTGRVMYSKTEGTLRSYKLIKIEDVFKRGRNLMARYTEPETKKTGEISLQSVHLYEIPAFTCVTASY